MNGDTFNVLPEDLQITQYLGFMHHLLTRAFQPLRRITIETVNGEPAARSPYVDALRTGFEVLVEQPSVVVYRRRR